MTPTIYRNSPWLFMVLLGALSAGVALAASQEYVGRDTCVECHQEQAKRWRGSHHDLAMQKATEETVLGNFDEVEFEQFGIISRFFRDGGRFMVRTDGPDGEMADYPIKYTFGVHPLQQYLIEFPGGRLQALDIAWDSRGLEEGGQRWIHLHPQDPVRHDDPLHWTGPNLNWNYMCAYCHSTNLQKNYDIASDSYRTTWSEIDVSCEACHGPGLAHLRWAEAKARGEVPKQPNKGLSVRFNERSGVSWTLDAKTGSAQRSAPKLEDIEIEVCARCHSRRSQLSDPGPPGQPFMDAFRPSWLAEGLYHADGQIQDEVYVWGSFVQSKMYRAGVTCSDCHDPHTATLRLPGDGVCHLCHAADRFATKAHHFHPPESTGASCVECHMPSTTYMVVDARHDHSMRVPRPDLTVAIGTPNACNQCHADKSPQWAAKHVESWYGRRPKRSHGYALTLDAARKQGVGAPELLQALAADAAQPVIARATAQASLGAYPDRRTLMLVQRGLNATSALERLAALDALSSFDRRWRLLALPLLWDNLGAVRVEAARLLAPFPSAELPAEHRSRVKKGIQEYTARHEFSAERPESQLSLAGLYVDQRRYGEAEQAYRIALKQQPRFIPAYVNFAQMLASTQREPEAEALLRRGLELSPDSAALENALGLSLVRQKKKDDALPFLERAAQHEPEVSRYAYVFAVALESGGALTQALLVLEQAHRRHPGNTEILQALATFNRDAGRRPEARRYAAKLQELAPENAAVEQLVRDLDGER